MNPRLWLAVGQFLGIGWYIAAAIILPTWAGVWLDGKAGTAPLFILIGVILGVVVAFYGTYKMASGYLTGRPGSRDDDGTRD